MFSVQYFVDNYVSSFVIFSVAILLSILQITFSDSLFDTIILFFIIISLQIYELLIGLEVVVLLMLVELLTINI